MACRDLFNKRKLELVQKRKRSDVLSLTYFLNPRGSSTKDITNHKHIKTTWIIDLNVSLYRKKDGLEIHNLHVFNP